MIREHGRREHVQGQKRREGSGPVAANFSCASKGYLFSKVRRTSKAIHAAQMPDRSPDICSSHLMSAMVIYFGDIRGNHEHLILLAGNALGHVKSLWRDALSMQRAPDSG